MKWGNSSRSFITGQRALRHSICRLLLLLLRLLLRLLLLLLLLGSLLLGSLLLHPALPQPLVHALQLAHKGGSITHGGLWHMGRGSQQRRSGLQVGPQQAWRCEELAATACPGAACR